MRIGLIDVDEYTTSYKGDKHPNLPLMKISAYHKSKGDLVEKWFPLEHYDIVYKAKVFKNDKDIQSVIYADHIIEGGTGYDSNLKLNDEIEHIYPDYEIYKIENEAHGFLTRGCPRHCPFCIVSDKEGRKSYVAGALNEFWKGQKYIQLYDPNILACNERDFLLEQLVNSKSYIDFNQGLDIRLADSDVIKQLNRMKIKQIHFAWDNPRDDLSKHFQNYAAQTDHKPHGHFGIVYVLTNYWSSFEDDLYRIDTLKSLNFDPYVMIYDKDNAEKNTFLYKDTAIIRSSLEVVILSIHTNKNGCIQMRQLALSIQSKNI